ncbi:MAG TPA: OmpA family protein [Bacteroidales bacterium]|nr:OmpA family protein [Bacteroidales bacterium]
MVSFHKIFIIITFICVTDINYGQKELIKTYYKNGRIESKGRVYKYSMFYDVKKLKKLDNKFTMIQKKISQWKYWYDNGGLRRIENYKLVIDKKFNDLPDGKWAYFNEDGIKYREEIFKDGILVNTIKDIYQDSKLAGRISLVDGTSDTTLFASFTKENNLVINPDFDIYFFKPVRITYHGDTPIDDWIPYWTAPGPYTPDYISNLRYIDALSYGYMFEMPLPSKFNYAGIALYKESSSYSEYIQGRLIAPLIKDKMYCLRTSMNLCSYSKFTVNRLSFYISPTSIRVDSTNENSFSPQISFSELPVKNDRFITLCNYFTAKGGEMYITAGRFSKPGSLEVIKRDNFTRGLFGLEKAAYYLIDNIQLFEINDTLECHCINDAIRSISLKSKPKEIYSTDLDDLNKGIPVVIENVNFDFDSFTLLKNSESALLSLLNYLNSNPDLKVSIEGHTDDVGTQDYNQELSLNRAKSVYNWLISNGISSNRLSYAGYGKKRPLFDDTDQQHKALNRRVEVLRIYK